MAEKKDASSKKKRKKQEDSSEKDYKGIVRVTEKVQTTYTVLEKKRADEPGSNEEDKASFQRFYTVMNPKRKKAARPPSIGSKYV
tara:strand:+ start:215 stop:469 length:255 start_codon:yes stop_codon:yes gene_type:complete